MRFSLKSIGTIGILSICGGLLLHILLFTLLRIEVPEVSPLPDEPAFVVWQGSESDKEGARATATERAFLFDSSPLFMPNRWAQASRMDTIASLQQATNLFVVYPPVLRLDNALPEFPAVTSPENLDMGRLTPGGPQADLAFFGREPMEAPDSPFQPGPSVVVRSLSGAALTKFPAIVFPEVVRQSEPTILWEKAIFYVTMKNGRSLGPPYIANRTGIAEWDAILSDWIGSSGFQRQLGDGYFRITIFP